MAKIEKVEKSRKEQICSKCRKVLPVGSSYLKSTPFRARTIVRCTECGLKSYETSGSDYVREIGNLCENWKEEYSADESGVEDIKSFLEEIRDQQQDSFDNIPENLQQGTTGELLENRVEQLESAINDLEDIDEDSIREEAEEEVKSEHEYEFEGKTEEEIEALMKTEEYVDEVLTKCDEAFGEAIESALSNLEY